MKDELRNRIRKKRNALPQSEVIEKSKRIKKTIFDMTEFKKSQAVLFYVSYNNEVSTHDMIKESLTARKKVAVPVTDTDHHCLHISQLKNWDELAYGAYTILEPKKECIREIPLAEIEVIFIPGIVFDMSGHRIGHGEGYYDDLLKHMSHALLVGLAFDFQIIDTIPAETHDIPVHKIVTEKRIIHCV
jgi:5-formyltetrahydrofolate cyclo-ligase